MLIPIILAIVAITVASFFLNAVFAFAIAQPGKPEIRPAIAESTTALEADRALRRGARPAARPLDDGRDAVGSPWFTLSLGQ